MATWTRYGRNIAAAVTAAGTISLAAVAVAVVSFGHAARTGELARGKQAGDLVRCHQMAQLLERKVAKSRTYILTGDEAFVAEMEDARSEFMRVLGELRASVVAEPASSLIVRVGELESSHHAILRDAAQRRRTGARPIDLTPVLVARLKPVRDELDATVLRLIDAKEAQLRASDEAAEAGLVFARRVSLAAGLLSLAAVSVVLWLVRRMTALQLQVEQTLTRSNERLDVLVAERTRELSTFNRELESFSYSVAHDLRTPLRAITNFSELSVARAEGCGDPALLQNLERIRSAGLRMGQLIDALLTLSRLTRRPFSPQEIDVSALVSEVGAEIAAANRERRVGFTVQPNLGDIADADLLRAAIYNLLDNAWKFTAGRPDAAIEFGRTTVDGEPCYFVRDNGVGFDERFIGKLFAPFERLHSAKQFPGTGIGLATVERVVRRHGGSVWAEGRLGQGARFFFTLNRRVPTKEHAAPGRGQGDG